MSRRSHISHSCRQNFSTLGRSDHNTDQGDALACATMAFPHHRDSRTSQATLPSGVAFHDERVSTCQLWRPANVPPCLCLRCVPAVLGPHRPGTNLTRLSSPYPLGRLQLALMEWLPMLLALVPPLYTSAGYTFARGTHQPPPFGSARGCTDLEELLTDPRDYADAIDLCFDDQFSCPLAKPFVGEAMINASSGGTPAMVQIKDSNDWLPALEPAHPSRGPRRTTKDFVPVVGCMVTNHQFNEPRFVLSAADVRCRPSTGAATFPAECDGGASQRNVMIESTEAAISFVERTTRQSARRELGLFDTESDHAKGKRTALMLVLSPKDFTNPVDAWTSDNSKSDPTARDGKTGHWLDPTFSDPRQCVETAVRMLRLPPAPSVS